MSDIFEACEDLVRNGLAEEVSGSAIRFTGEVDLEKLAKVERSYAEAFRKRWLEADAKEREAERRFRDFVVTY